jgi:hypothetical protein
MNGFILGWALKRWHFFRLRRRMRRFAELLMQAREAGPELFRYVEALEMRVDSQERELNVLRWTVRGEQMADWDLEQDQLEWRRRVERNKVLGGRNGIRAEN